MKGIVRKLLQILNLAAILLFLFFASCSLFKGKTHKQKGPVYVKLTEEQIREEQRRKALGDSLSVNADSLSAVADSLAGKKSEAVTKDSLSSSKPQVESSSSPQKGGSKKSLKDTVSVDSTTTQTATDTGGVKTKVYLIYSDSLTFNKFDDPDAQLLRGHVQFRHDSTYMYCDSARFYQMANSLEAFGNVRIEQGDTLFVYGDMMFYDGNTQLARLRENVKMENGTMTLLSDSLDYDRKANVAYYLEGGIISDTVNVLTSVYGVYNPSTKISVFEDSVRLENKSFVLTTDSLQYNTETRVATIIAPTVITADSSSVIHTSRGYYNTLTESSTLLDRSVIDHKQQQIVGDSLIYNRIDGIAHAYGNIEMNDTIQHISLSGEYGYYDQNGESGSFVTDSALLIQRSRQDTLYLHADTLRSVPDSTYKIIRAYHAVRFYRTAGQGICDSMEYRTRDSILTMYTQPILWGKENQLTGDTITIFMNDSTIDRAHIRPYAFSIQEVDSLNHHNQMSGKEMMVYFDAGEINKIDVSGNVETIFYPLEKDSTMIGMNRAVSSYLTIHVRKQKLERLIMWPQVEGTMYPIERIDPETTQLKGFKWFGNVRPTDPKDVFRSAKRSDAGVIQARRKRTRD